MCTQVTHAIKGKETKKMKNIEKCFFVKYLPRWMCATGVARHQRARETGGGPGRLSNQEGSLMHDDSEIPEARRRCCPEDGRLPGFVALRIVTTR
jgi:hypothetical protein